MPQYTRKLTIDAPGASDEERCAPATISTEYPVDRGDFSEVLSHAPGAVDLSRAPLPLIESHDTATLNIGVVEDLRVEKNRLRGTVRLGSSARAKEIWDDIKAGIVRNLSVGYEWLDYRNEGDKVIVTNWRPYESSLVFSGADPHAGLYRSQSNYSGAKKMTTETAKKVAGEIRAETMQREKVETDRCDGIRKLGNDHQRNTLAIEAIESGKSVDQFRALVLEANKVQIRVPPSNRTMEDIIDPLGELRRRNTPAHDKDRAAYSAGQWLRGQVLGNESAQNWCRDNGIQIRAMSGTIGAAGGFLVPTELSNNIIDLVEQYGIARQEAMVVTMGSDHMEIPRRTGGITAYYVGQGEEITDSDASWDLIGLNSRKLAVLSRYSSELAEDAVVDVGHWLAQEIARGFAQAEDAALFNGDGTSTYGGIEGINHKILGLAGAVDAQSGHDLFSEIDAVDLATLKAALPGHAQARGKWYCSSAAYALIFERLSAAAGGNTLQTLAAGQRLSFLGHEIVITESMPTSTGTLVNESMLLFGDLEAGVTFGSRRDVRIAIDESRYFTTDQLAIRGTTRYDLVVHGTGTAAEAGPIVSLVGA